MPADRVGAAGEGVAAPPAHDVRDLYAEAASPGNLRSAFQRVQANRGAAGGDGVTVDRFALVAESQIDLLSRALLAGRYRPGPLRRVWVPKRSGGQRPLDIPCVGDRVVQTSVAQILDPILDPTFEASSFAYRRGRSVAGAVARVSALRRQGFTHVVDGDIERFFERVSHERLIDKLESHIDDGRLVDLIWLWLEAASLTGRGLPQGSPVSPILSNLYLDSVDEKIAAAGFRLVRFADDFLVLARTPDNADKALSLVADALADEGLELNRDKTRLVTFGEGFRFLGHLFVRSIVQMETPVDDSPGEAEVSEIEASSSASREEMAGESESSPRERFDPLLPVYVVGGDKTLGVRGNRLIVTDAIGRVTDVPPGPVDRIELHSGVDATLAALELAVAHDIDVVKVNGRGEPVLRVTAPGPERASRHLAQAAVLLDGERRAVMACAIAEARIRNQRALLRRANRSRNDPEVAAACLALNRRIRMFRNRWSVEEAMGHEGAATAIYWPAFGRTLPEEVRFSRRSRRPAADVANAAVNALCDMLARDLRNLVVKIGLHPGFGVLHAVQDGRDSLVLDLMEAFRAPVVEACAAALFGRRALTADASFIIDADGVRISRDGFAALIRGYEAWVARPIRSPRSGRDLLWRNLMEEEARAFARSCETGEAFTPYVMDY